MENTYFFEIQTSFKTHSKGCPSAPSGYTWKRVRNTPIFKNKKDADKELENLLSKKNAKPRDHYTIGQKYFSQRNIESELRKGRKII